VPVTGDLVTIVRSSVNYAEGKHGVVEGPKAGGFAVRIKARKVDAKNYGSLEQQESEATVWASEVKPYTPPKDEPKR
jgi:hypothetical protein